MVPRRNTPGRFRADTLGSWDQAARASKPVGSYTPYVIVDDLIFISGQTPKIDGDLVHRGILRNGDDIEMGRRTARLCAINILSQLELACEGDLSKVTRCVRVGGFVSSALDFILQSQVIDGASQSSLQVFGDAGDHARTSIDGRVPRRGVEV